MPGHGSPARLCAVSSTGLSVLQAGLLLRVVGATRSADTFFVLFAFGQAVLTVGVVGILYPARLAEGGDSGRWRRPLSLAAASGAASTALGAGLLLVEGYVAARVMTVAALLAASSAAAGAAGVLAVRRACAGRSSLLAGLAVPANATACAALLVPATSSVVGMSSGLLVGNACLLACLLASSGSQRARLRSAPADRHPAPSRWLAANATAGYAAALTLQAAAAQLPAGTATVYALGTRVVYAFLSIGLTSVLPMLVHWGSQEGDALRWTARRLLVPGTWVLLAIAMLSAVVLPAALPAAALLGWLLVAAGATLVVQVTYGAGDFTALKVPALLAPPISVAAAVAALVCADGRLLLAGLTATSAATVVPLCLRRGWHSVLTAGAVATVVSLVAAVAAVPTVAVAVVVVLGASALVSGSRRTSSAELRSVERMPGAATQPRRRSTAPRSTAAVPAPRARPGPGGGAAPPAAALGGCCPSDRSRAGRGRPGTPP